MSSLSELLHADSYEVEVRGLECRLQVIDARGCLVWKRTMTASSEEVIPDTIKALEDACRDEYVFGPVPRCDLDLHARDWVNSALVDIVIDLHGRLNDLIKVVDLPPDDAERAYIMSRIKNEPLLSGEAYRDVYPMVPSFGEGLATPYNLVSILQSTTRGGR